MRDAATDATLDEPPDPRTWGAVRPFLGAWAAWAVAYTLFDALPTTIDRVEGTWPWVIVLAIPLQLALGFVAVVLGGTTRGAFWRGIVRTFAWACTALILAHVVVTLATL